MAQLRSSETVKRSTSIQRREMMCWTMSCVGLDKDQMKMRIKMKSKTDSIRFKLKRIWERASAWALGSSLWIRGRTTSNGMLWASRRCQVAYCSNVSQSKLVSINSEDEFKDEDLGDWNTKDIHHGVFVHHWKISHHNQKWKLFQLKRINCSYDDVKHFAVVKTQIWKL